MLTLVCHAECKQGSNPGLTLLGHEQAQWSGEHLQTDELTDIWVSNTSRAKQTVSHFLPHLPKHWIKICSDLDPIDDPKDLAKQVERIAASINGVGNLIIVSEKGILDALTCTLVDEPAKDLFKFNCAMTRFQKTGSSWSVVSCGSDHLPSHLQTTKK